MARNKSFREAGLEIIAIILICIVMLLLFGIFLPSILDIFAEFSPEPIKSLFEWFAHTGRKIIQHAP
jgi:hypothetical protein